MTKKQNLLGRISKKNFEFDFCYGGLSNVGIIVNEKMTFLEVGDKSE